MPNNLVDLSFFVKVFAVNEALSNNTTAPSKPTAPTAPTADAKTGGFVLSDKSIQKWTASKMTWCVAFCLPVDYCD